MVVIMHAVDVKNTFCFGGATRGTYPVYGSSARATAASSAIVKAGRIILYKMELIINDCYSAQAYIQCEAT